MRKISLSLISFALGLAALGCTRNLTNNVPVPSSSTVSTPQQSSNPVTTQAESGGGGVINGGGGRGVVCEKNGTKSVQLLDLYESRALYHLDALDLGNDEDAAKDKLADLLAKHFWNPYTIERSAFAKALRKSLIDAFVDRVHFIDEGKTLKLVDDAYAPVLEDGCHPAQIAFYYDESVLLVDKTLWNQLNVTNKMALIAHEALYFFARQSGTTNSMSVRKLVGYLFSTKGAQGLFDEVPADRDKFMNCVISKDGFTRGQFFMFSAKDADGKRAIDLVFSDFAQPSSLFRMSAVLPGVSFLSMLSPNFAGSTTAELQRDTYPSKDLIRLDFKGVHDENLTANLEVLTGAGALTESYNVSCPMPRDSSALETYSTTPATYLGKPNSGSNESLVIQANGSMTYEASLQVGGPGGISRAGVVPYPTECRLVQHAVVLAQTETEVSYQSISVELGDQSQLTNTAHCQEYVDAFNKQAARGDLHFSFKKSDYDLKN